MDLEELEGAHDRLVEENMDISLLARYTLNKCYDLVFPSVQSKMIESEVASKALALLKRTGCKHIRHSANGLQSWMVLSLLREHRERTTTNLTDSLQKMNVIQSFSKASSNDTRYQSTFFPLDLVASVPHWSLEWRQRTLAHLKAYDKLWESFGFDEAFVRSLAEELQHSDLDVDAILLGTRPKIPREYLDFPPYYKDIVEMNEWKAGGEPQNVSVYDIGSNAHPFLQHVCAGSRRESSMDIFQVKIPITFLVTTRGKAKKRIALTYSVGVLRLIVLHPGHVAYHTLQSHHMWRVRDAPNLITHDLFACAALLRYPGNPVAAGALLCFAYVQARTSPTTTPEEYAQVLRSLVSATPHPAYERVKDTLSRLAAVDAKAARGALKLLQHVANALLQDCQDENLIDTVVTTITPQSLEDERF